MLDLKAIFSESAAGLAAVPPAAVAPELDPFTGWVRRPDCHGRMGWEAPDLPEAVRWWARCDWDELPEQPARLRKQTLKREPVPQACAGCVPAGLVDTLDPKSKRPSQGQLRGFGGV